MDKDELSNMCTYLSNGSVRLMTAVRVIVKRAYAYAYTVRYSVGKTRLSIGIYGERFSRGILTFRRSLIIFIIITLSHQPHGL